MHIILTFYIDFNFFAYGTYCTSLMSRIFPVYKSNMLYEPNLIVCPREQHLAFVYVEALRRCQQLRSCRGGQLQWSQNLR